MARAPTATAILLAAVLAVTFSSRLCLAADRALIDAAKRDGKVTWYTTQIIDQFARPVVEAFERKYGIHVDYVRANTGEIELRVLNEGAAGKLQADVIDGTASATALEKAGFLLKWVPDAASHLGKQYVDANGYWTATNLYVMTPGYNTNLVPKGTEPRTYEDLLDPKWKGKIAWSSPSTTYQAADFIGLILADMGEEKGRAYLRQLARQDIAEVDGSARQVLDQVIAGEYPLALMIFNHHTIISAALGAPSAWIPMRPALATLSVMSVTHGGPHPAAGKLLVDYLTSPEGQRLFRDAGYIPVDPDVPPLHPELRPDGTTLTAIYLTPEELQSSLVYWKGIYTEYFH
jgi:ABC-type Fe3+ transport system substrate-binding protein